jgi:hypothetical protein
MPHNVGVQCFFAMGAEIPGNLRGRSPVRSLKIEYCEVREGRSPALTTPSPKGVFSRDKQKSRYEPCKLLKMLKKTGFGSQKLGSEGGKKPTLWRFWRGIWVRGSRIHGDL